MIEKRLSICLIFIMCILCIGIGIFYKKNTNTTINANNSKYFKGTILEVSDNHVIVEPFSDYDISNSTDKVLVDIDKDSEYKIGDIIIVFYEGVVKESYPSTVTVTEIELVNNNKETDTDNISNSNDDKTSEIDNSDNLNNNNYEKSDVSNNQSNSSVSYSEDDVIGYFDSGLREVSTYKNDISYKDKAKNLFIDVVDFLFYDKEIKGYTFKGLSNTAKLKVLNIAFKIDDKIDGIFPGYKGELSDKYHDGKNMIVAKYLEITANVCSNNEEYCDTAKKTWKVIKEKASISWSVIKEYASSGISNLKEWYQVYSGK